MWQSSAEYLYITCLPILLEVINGILTSWPQDNENGGQGVHYKLKQTWYMYLRVNLLNKCLICRDVTKISSYRSYAITRQGIKQLLVLFSILFLGKWPGVKLISPNPQPLLTAQICIIL